MPALPPAFSFDTRSRAWRAALKWGLAASVLVHGLLFAALRLLAPLVPEAPPPLPPHSPLELTVIQVEVQPDPPGGSSAPPSGAVSAPPSPAPAVDQPPPPTFTPAEVFTGVPTPVPEANPLTVVHPATPITDGGTPGGGGGTPGSTGTGDGGTGDGPGSGGGTGDGDGDGAGSNPGPPPIVRNPERTANCALPFPVWPDAARRAGYRARARIELLVDVSGRVTDARILERFRIGRGNRDEPVQSFPYDIDEAMLRAVRNVECRPARQAGAAVSSYAVRTLSMGT